MNRQYSLEVKIQVIKEALKGESYGQVARRHQINCNTVCRWVNEYKNGKYGDISGES